MCPSLLDACRHPMAATLGAVQTQFNSVVTCYTTEDALTFARGEAQYAPSMTDIDSHALARRACSAVLAAQHHHATINRCKCKH
jgi:hypothetical protein